jgi:hypothetical protein
MPSPIERMIDAADLRCTLRGAPAWTCGCGRSCRCGGHHRPGEACPNLVHVREEAAGKLAAYVAAVVIQEMRAAYPEPMTRASGGFQRTLRAAIERETRTVLLKTFETCAASYS